MKKKASVRVMLYVLLACLMLCSCAKKEEPQSVEEPPVEASFAEGEVYTPELTTEITVSLRHGEITELDKLSGLVRADLRGSEDYEEVYQWAQAHPEVSVSYTVPLPNGTVVDERVTELDLRGMGPGKTEELLRALRCLPKLSRVELGDESEGLTLEEVAQLEEALPDVRFTYAFTVYGVSASTTDTKLNLSHIPVEDGGAQVRQAMACMPKLSYLDMDSCGVSNEEMAAIRDDFPKVKVVWRVWFGDHYSARTDTECILASKPSLGGELYVGNCESLKYCTDVRYLDIGHNPSLTTIDFIRYMPKLEVAILAMCAWTDGSPLACCPELEYLELQPDTAYEGAISDLTPLSGLQKLRHLNLCNTSVMDISPLYGLTKLERLWLGGWVNVSMDQIEEMKRCAPDCEINYTCGDPTEGHWRYVDFNELNYTFILHPRYQLLREQFRYDEPDAYSIDWDNY